MKTVSRRRFLQQAAAAGTGLALGSASCPAAEKARSAGAVTPARTGRPDWPVWDQREEQALLDVLRSGKWIRGTGTRVKEFEQVYATRMQAKHCLATSSGTTALLTALGALGIGPGDEVILPPYTFIATFNVITLNFALPVFVDSDPVTFQIDATKIAASITPDTKLLLPVHIGGYPADLEAIEAIAKARGIPFVEDACQAGTAQWRGRPVGTLARAACISFQATKNMTSGEGGAVLTNDDAFAEECIRFHAPFRLKEGDKVSGRSSNHRLTEFQAGLLLAQLTRLDAQSKLRVENAAYLSSLLEQVPGVSPARFHPGATRGAYHLYLLRYDPARFAGLSKPKLIQALSKEGVFISSGYLPLNTSPHAEGIAADPHYQRIYGKKAMAGWLERNRCPVNDRLCAEAMWFSQTFLLRPRSEMERVAEAFARVQRRAGDLAKA